MEQAVPIILEIQVATILAIVNQTLAQIINQLQLLDMLLHINLVLMDHLELLEQHQQQVFLNQVVA